MRLLISLLLLAIAGLCFAPVAQAFCGFYVAKADSSLYNQASQVAIARDGNRTVLTMANDYQGDVKDFAMVVPVPVVLQPEQVRVVDPKIIQRLDAFSAPRLVEYFDVEGDGCFDVLFGNWWCCGISDIRPGFGVTVESRFTVGEYDIIILSAKESDGLETWLRQNDYRIPEGASELLRPYIRQGMKFFVAKVNLEAFDEIGFQSLRPLQMSYESRRFMLPIRLGMVNAQAEQNLIVYLLSPQGRVELTNYRTVTIPTDFELPAFIKDTFNDFYKTMFQRAYEREGRNVAFLEYAWNMRWCDPCADRPLNPEELEQAGVFWSHPSASGRQQSDVFITRLHIRYTRDQFPEDLMFQTTSNRQSFQGRYVLHHALTRELGFEGCIAEIEHLHEKYPKFANNEHFEAWREERLQEAQERWALEWSADEDYSQWFADEDYYSPMLLQRFEREAQNLARLTGWDIDQIRRQISTLPQPSPSLWRVRWPRPEGSSDTPPQLPDTLRSLLGVD